MAEGAELLDAPRECGCGGARAQHRQLLPVRHLGLAQLLLETLTPQMRLVTARGLRRELRLVARHSERLEPTGRRAARSEGRRGRHRHRTHRLGRLLVGHDDCTLREARGRQPAQVRGARGARGARGGPGR